MLARRLAPAPARTPSRRPTADTPVPAATPPVAAPAGAQDAFGGAASGSSVRDEPLGHRREVRPFIDAVIIPALLQRLRRDQ